MFSIWAVEAVLSLNEYIVTDSNIGGQRKLSITYWQDKLLLLNNSQPEGYEINHIRPNNSIDGLRDALQSNNCRLFSLKLQQIQREFTWFRC